MPDYGQPNFEELGMEEHEPVQAFACTLPPPELRRRRVEVLAAVRRRVQKIDETELGFVFTFEDSRELRSELDEFVRFEAACCSFIEMALVEYAGSIQLTTKGAPGAKRFIEAEFVNAGSEPASCGCGSV
jgi:hypothetical protein